MATYCQLGQLFICLYFSLSHTFLFSTLFLFFSIFLILLCFSSPISFFSIVSTKAILSFSNSSPSASVTFILSENATLRFNPKPFSDKVLRCRCEHFSTLQEMLETQKFYFASFLCSTRLLLANIRCVQSTYSSQVTFL